jgi:stearoyl-CoA desaturase (delta-9 desaturase)
MFKSISKAFWFVFVPMTTLALSTIYMLVTGVIPLIYLWATLVMWVLVCGLGIACGYHRVFSHKTHKLPTWKENIILFFAVFAGQGSSIFWAATHRGYHHPYADTEKDLHSPVVHGILHAYVGWFMQITEKNVIVNIKYAIDLLRKSNHVWFHHHYLKILWTVPLIICLFDWRLAFCAFFLVTGMGLLQDNLINILGHTKAFIGYRNFNTADHSFNNLIMGFLTWGQGWHNNHHHAPGSYDFGRGVSSKWWEIDPCLIFLPFVGPIKK